MNKKDPAYLLYYEPEKPEFFALERMLTDGHGVSLDVNIIVTDTTLYLLDKKDPLHMSDFIYFVIQRDINATKTAELLNCSRRNVIELTKRGKSHPIKTSERNTLYPKSEVLKMIWQQTR